MKNVLRVIILLLVLAVSAPALAKKIGGVTLPDTIKMADHALVLNGAGLRTKVFFKIYVGGLYLEKASKDGSAIIKADKPMLVRLHFIYDGVSPEKLQTGWIDGFALTAPNADAALQKGMKAFTALFAKEAKENDIYDIGWLPGTGLEVRYNGTLLATISGLALKQALFAIWLGDKPVDKSLRGGMLGK